MSVPGLSFKKFVLGAVKGTCLVVFLALNVGCKGTHSESAVTLTHGVDTSAGGLPAYIITTENATYYLEKSGGGLSSLLDQDGIDWIGFNHIKGSGWKGEYRGFPNAVHKQDGNFFHAMNAGTDPATSEITIHAPNHVRIVFTSENGKWEGQWDFYPTRCDFTMTTVSPGYQYWIQYEGVPGGEMNKTDFWFNSASPDKHPIEDAFSGDLPAPEWFAFGDKNFPRMLYFLKHEDDDLPDDYVSRPFMTVLGFGRQNKDKFLSSPVRVSFGFVESVDYKAVQQAATRPMATSAN
ncbi:hypothetical protein [Alteromonas sp. 14N.309.X.WAT.G.H12]|uniref:hypothetical protein n=1 Tax=Alteromonas sp. 14N.309.X.WAT.G.H12 TaxID=3120824 RepID=UPI002FD1255F